MYEQKFLRSTFSVENSLLHPNGFHRVKFHQDKDTSHTTKSITIFLEKMEIDASIEYTQVQLTSENSDRVLSKEYRALCLLKRALSKCKSTIIDELLKISENQ